MKEKDSPRKPSFKHGFRRQIKATAVREGPSLLVRTSKKSLVGLFSEPVGCRLSTTAAPFARKTKIRKAL